MHQLEDLGLGHPLGAIRFGVYLSVYMRISSQILSDEITDVPVQGK